MREYHSKAIRNVAILGHMDCGKTTMTEAFLYLAGAIDKKGEVEKKNTKLKSIKTPTTSLLFYIY